MGDAVNRIGRDGGGKGIFFFYEGQKGKGWVGSLPTRRLLTASLETPLRQIMVPRVVAVPASATILDACEFFVLYKFLAFPIVDEKRRVVGIIDAHLFAEEILEAGDGVAREGGSPITQVSPDFFEALGFHIEQVRGASPWRVFRL